MQLKRSYERLLNFSDLVVLMSALKLWTVNNQLSIRQTNVQFRISNPLTLWAHSR